MRSTLSLTALALCIGSTAMAQFSVLTVDANGGGQFADLPAAVQAARPGDILDVLPGTYTGFATTKGIHVFGRSGVTVSGAINIANITSLERMTMRNLTLINVSLPLTNIIFHRSPGSIVLENVQGAQFRSERCDSVRLYNCNFQNAAIVYSNVVMENCSLVAPFPNPGMWADFSNVTLSRCQIIGGRAGSTFPGRPGIQSQASDFFVTGLDATHQIAVGPGSVGPGQTSHAIAGRGTLTIDPVVVLRGYGTSAPVDPMILVTRTELPVLRTAGAVLGSVATVELSGTTNQTYLLALGAPTAPTRVVGLIGSLWLQGPSLAAFGTLNGAGSAVNLFPVPNLNALSGVHVSFQAITTEPGQDLRFSNPAAFVLRR